MTRKIIGIFGGTFDPVHFGHLRTAFEVQLFLDLAEVRFIPSRLPPHRDPPVAPDEVRLAMLASAVDQTRTFIVDDRELRRPGPSYTVDTLESLHTDLPDHVFCLILGMDAFLGVTTWHHWTEVFDLAHVVVAHRPGWTVPTAGVIGDLVTERQAPPGFDLSGTTGGRIVVREVSQLEIASSAIRNMVGRRIKPHYLLPEAVGEIIAESGCYDAEDAQSGTTGEMKFGA